jgi:hypothetical protein
VRRAGLAALALACALGAGTAPAAQAAFGLLQGEEGFAARVLADGGGPAQAAGSHPYRLDFDLGLRTGPGGLPDGDLRNLEIELTPGVLLNPAVVPECRPEHFNAPRVSPFEESRSGESCPEESQLGTVEVRTAGAPPRRFGVFNLAPPPGVVAQLGFSPYGTPIVLDLALRAGAEGSYAALLRARNLTQALQLTGLSLELWGTPWGVSHNGERGNCLNQAEPAFPWAKCSVGPPGGAFEPLAYLTLPTRCSGPLPFALQVGAWGGGGEDSRSELGRGIEGAAAELGHCDALSFASTPAGLLSAKQASSPSGFAFRLANDQATLSTPGQPAPPQTRAVTVRLPAGVTVNPSLGAGLGSCSPARYAAETAFSPPGAGCPEGSKIGELRVRTPLFSEAIEGAVHLATPDDPGSAGAENPFDSLLALYLVAKLPQRGILVKVAGRVDPDPGSGNLTARFDGLPQLPYAELEINLRTGQRAPLVTPAACGPARTRIRLDPWAGPAGATDYVSSSQVETGIGGRPCPLGGAPPFAPDALAGAYNSNVGSYTPYFVRLSRDDDEQEITSYSLELPKGIVGKLAGIPFCPEAAIALARARRGAVEAADPSCPAASQVGRTLSGYGVGGALAYAEGRIYLAGPHNGAPLSLVTVNSATVGPFDLGTIVVRSAFAVDPRTAQLRIDSRASDPIPHILGGIPLHLREVRVYVDRPEFTRNPTSCEASELVSTLIGSGARFEDSGDDSTATVRRHFQLLNCLTLGFRPRLGLRLRGGTRRGSYPSLRATFASRGARDANLKQIAVSTPHSLFLAQRHIRRICTRVQFAAERCPRGSVYGRAVAHTPLFDEPLRGRVFLRSSENPLPDLVTVLHAGAVKIVIEGRIGPSRGGGIRAVFEELPDAPIERFTMVLFGGRRGLLQNSVDICTRPPIAGVRALGQNNRGHVFTAKLRGRCGKKGKQRRHRGPQRRRSG